MTTKSDNDHAQAIAEALKVLNKAIFEAKTEGDLEVFLQIFEEHDAKKIVEGPAYDPKVCSKQYVKAAVVRNYLRGVNG